MKLTVKEADFEVSEASTVQLDVCFAFVWSELSQTCSEFAHVGRYYQCVAWSRCCLCVVFQPAWQHFNSDE